MQERLLSPRTVHFGSTVFWECREIVACETYPEGLPRADRGPSNKVWTGMCADDKGIAHEESEALDIWHRAVMNYSRSDLTKTEDKLVAISGVAKTLQPILQDEYVAGLWKKRLLQELLWSVSKDTNGEDEHATRPTPYRGRSYFSCEMGHL